MRKVIILQIFCFWSVALIGQITIKKADMPAPNDTFRIDATTSIPPINLNDTGPDHTWDFANLFTIYSRTDTFIHPNQTPLFYWLSFNMFNTSVATKIQTPVSFGNLQATNVYNYYNTTNSKYEQVGTAATLSGIPLTAKNNANDVIYRFPLTYNHTDSCLSNFEFNLPNVLYFKRNQFRKNIVDGWGTITTPYGTFNCVRVRSNIDQTDSIYLDTLGQGFKFNRKYAEFKWLANDEGVPIAYVQALISFTGQLQIQFVEFKNKNTVNREALFTHSVQVSPQPSSDFVVIRTYLENTENLQAQWIDLQGKVVSSFDLPSSIGFQEWHIDKPAQGLYLLKIIGNQGSWTQKILWE